MSAGRRQCAAPRTLEIGEERSFIGCRLSARSPQPAAPRGLLYRAGSALLLLAAAGLLVQACRSANAPALRKETRLIMDTYVSISAYGPTAQADKALDLAFTRLEEINQKFNHLDSTSPVFAFNSRNEPIIDTEVVAVLKAAQEISVASGGVFDVTVEPLVRLWGFYSGKLAVPAQPAIDSCLQFVGYQNLLFELGRVTKKNPNTTIDLGGIAKGYALKEAARVLRSSGIDSALIDAGGDVYALGKKANQNWKVGVRNPRAEGIIGIAAVSNLAVVTSGDYERYFFGADSVRYCHIIDAKTGWPAHTAPMEVQRTKPKGQSAGMASTTVIMRDPLAAQGWSKVLFVLGPDAIALGDAAGGFEALLIDDGLKAYMSKGLVGAMKLDLAGTGIEPAAGR